MDEIIFNQQINEIRHLMQQVEDPNLNNLNEGPLGGLFGKHGVMQQIGANYKNGSQISSTEKNCKKAKDIFQQINQSLTVSNKKLFDQLWDDKNNVNGLDVDPDLKEKYTNIITAILNTKSSVEKVTKDLVNNKSEYDLSQGVAQAEPEQKPAAEPQPAAQPQAPEEAPEEEPQQEPAQTGGAKVFNMHRDHSELDDFMRKKKAMNESATLLDEVAKEGKFDEAMKLLYMNSGKMIKSAGLANVNPDALTVILKLALATIMQKGQSGFINDVKEINNGFNMYRKAHKNLYVPKGQETKTEPAQPEQPAAAKPEASGVDRNQEAKELAKEYLESHGYEVTPKSIQEAAYYILKYHLK